MSWLLHESPGQRGSIITLHLHNQQISHKKKCLKHLSSQLGNSFFFHNLLLASTCACSLINYSGIFIFQQQANWWFSLACSFKWTPFCFTCGKHQSRFTSAHQNSHPSASAFPSGLFGYFVPQIFWVTFFENWNNPLVLIVKAIR